MIQMPCLSSRVMIRSAPVVFIFSFCSGPMQTDGENKKPRRLAPAGFLKFYEQIPTERRCLRQRRLRPTGILSAQRNLLCVILSSQLPFKSGVRSFSRQLQIFAPLVPCAGQNSSENGKRLQNAIKVYRENCPAQPNETDARFSLAPRGTSGERAGERGLAFSPKNFVLRPAIPAA